MGCCQLQAKVCARSSGQPLSQACAGKKCGYVNLTIAVDWDVKNQTKPNIPAVDNINHVMRKPASGKCEQQ